MGEKQLRYYDDCIKYRCDCCFNVTGTIIFAISVIFCRWLLSVHARGILSRLPQLLATCTGVFRRVLKIDSTKKIVKKLQGTAAGSASWCTNVGNESEEVLMSVLTESEGLDSLHPMAKSLIERLVYKIYSTLYSL